MTDRYQVYHTLEKGCEDLIIAGCWAHARRRFDEARKALPKSSQKSSIAYLALQQIQAIYKEESRLDGLSVQERTKRRQLTVKPLVEAYFAWVREKADTTVQKEKTHEGFQYSLNQENI